MLLSYQQTLAALIFFCLNIVPVSELSYKWTHSVAFWFWFIHVIAFIYSSCFLLTRVSLFGYSRLSDLVIMNEATISVSFHFLWVIPGVGLLGHMVNVYLILLGTAKVALGFCIPTNNEGQFVSSYPYQSLVSSDVLFVWPF